MTLDNRLQSYRLHAFQRGSTADILHAQPRKDSAPPLIIKVLRRSLNDFPIINRRFSYEQWIIGTLRHGGIPTLEFCGELYGRPFIALQWISGCTCSALCNIPTRKRRATTADVIRWITSLLDIIEYLHTRPNPVIHSDISPDNVVVDRNQLVHLIDFGCAQTLSRASPTASTWLGKPLYLSPEQARGQPWGRSSDLYQVGLLLYELLTGKPRNIARDAREARVMAAEPDALDLRQVPTSLHPILRGLLAPQPEQRWPDARACISALTQVCAREAKPLHTIKFELARAAINDEPMISG